MQFVSLDTEPNFVRNVTYYIGIWGCQYDFDQSRSQNITDGGQTQYIPTMRKVTKKCSMSRIQSFEPGSNQRPQDVMYPLQSRALPTELSKAMPSWTVALSQSLA